MKTQRATRTISALILAILAIGLLNQASGTLAGSAVTGADPDGLCDGLPPADCYPTIQQAVNNVEAGGTVEVYPGTYDEDVDLDDMNGGVTGNITVISVNDAGDPSPGSATVNGGNESAFRASGGFEGNVTIDGFIVTSADDDAIDLGDTGDPAIGTGTIRNVTVTAAADEGLDLTHTGDITVDNVTVNGAGEDGMNLETLSGVFRGQTSLPNVFVRNSLSNGNDVDGMNIRSDGNVDISDSVANDSVFDDGIDVDRAMLVFITNVTVNGNNGPGMDIDDGDDGVISVATLVNVTAIANAQTGIALTGAAEYSITDSIVTNNLTGIEINGAPAPGYPYSVNGNIICDNTVAGLAVTSGDSIDAEGNYWGSFNGPTHPTNPGGDGDLIIDDDNGGTGDVDFDPWIDTITPDANPDPAAVGEPVSVTFQFSGGGGAVFLGEGPGDLNADPAPFELTTDNGTLDSSQGSGTTVTEFINQPNGTLEVTLTPDAEGTATVTLTGPCELASQVTLEVEGEVTPPPPDPDFDVDAEVDLDPPDVELPAQEAPLTGTEQPGQDDNGDGPLVATGTGPANGSSATETYATLAAAALVALFAGAVVSIRLRPWR